MRFARESVRIAELISSDRRVINYEYPLNERIRTLLRLEDLFDKALHFIAANAQEDHHVALMMIFEILEVAGRSDLKFDMVQELERQRQTLVSFRNNPDISEDALSAALHEIEQTSVQLLGMQGKVGQHLRENGWLMSIRNRASIPGGVCEFDLPAYHYWLHRDPDQRRVALNAWLEPILPIRAGLIIVLRLLRASGRAEMQIASQGVFQLMLAGRTAQMLHLRVHRSDPYVPEISANKYALNIRFIAPDGDLRPRPAEADISFELTFCNL